MHQSSQRSHIFHQSVRDEISICSCLNYAWIKVLKYLCAHADVLRRLKDVENAGYLLYPFIFYTKHNPVATISNHFKPVHTRPLPGRSRIPPKHRIILPHLHQLVQRVNKCPVGKLLEKHCPLPKGWGDIKAKNDVQNESIIEEAELKFPRPITADLQVQSCVGRKKKHSSERDEKDGGKHAHVTKGSTSGFSTAIEALEPRKLQLNNGLIDDIGKETAENGIVTHRLSIDEMGPCIVPHAHVANFLWSFIRRTVPARLLGSNKCKKKLRKSIGKFVSLKRYENMNVHEIMKGMPLSSLDVIAGSPRQKKNGNKNSIPPSEYSYRYRRCCLWFGWIFASVLVPLLRALFYCTESEAYRQRVFYYRKPVWGKMVKEAYEETISKHFYPISDTHARAILSKRKIGVSKIRLLPKRTGLRLLVNMSRTSEVRFRQRNRQGKENKCIYKFPTINGVLKTVHAVLKYEASQQPEAFGSSTFGFNDIFCRFKSFVMDWRASKATKASLGGDEGQAAVKDHGPYVVCVDVSRAFDNIDVATLMGVVSNLLTSEEYTILKYTEVLTVMGTIKTKHRNVAVPSTAVLHDHFAQKAASLSGGQKSRIFVDAVTSDKITRNDVINYLEDYLGANLVRLRKKWRYQCRGIAQGGTPSTFLCSLYLGHVERMCLDPIFSTCGISKSMETPFSPVENSMDLRLTELAQVGAAATNPTVSKWETPAKIRNDPNCPSRSHTILLRLVDDWMLITRHKEVAIQFTQRLLQGIPGFNVLVNPRKTQVSFEMSIDSMEGHLKPSFYIETDGSRFMRWCGLLIDVDRLQLRADYTRYAGEHMSTTLNIPSTRNPGMSLGSKLCHYLRPKITPVLIDQDINGQKTVRINIYQAFILAAMKFHCYVRGLPKSPVLNNSQTWLLQAIYTGIKYVLTSTRANIIPRAAKSSRSQVCDPGIPFRHIEYLGLHAFHTVLMKKHSFYKDLLQKIEAKLREPQCIQCAPHLNAIVDPVHSGIFDDLIY